MAEFVDQAPYILLTKMVIGTATLFRWFLYGERGDFFRGPASCCRWYQHPGERSISDGRVCSAVTVTCVSEDSSSAKSKLYRFVVDIVLGNGSSGL